jgi:hypothetical protein
LTNLNIARVNKIRLCQCLARLSKKSQSPQILPSLDWSQSRHPSYFSVSKSLSPDTRVSVPTRPATNWFMLLGSSLLCLHMSENLRQTSLQHQLKADSGGWTMNRWSLISCWYRYWPSNYWLISKLDILLIQIMIVPVSLAWPGGCQFLISSSIIYLSLAFIFKPKHLHFNRKLCKYNVFWQNLIL